MPDLTKRTAMTDINQHHFDHLLMQKSILRPAEVAKLLGVSDVTVIKYMEDGQLFGFAFNSGEGLRMTRRIPRQAVVLLLLKSRTYVTEDYLAGIVSLLATLSAAELALIHEQFPRLTAKAISRQPVQPVTLRRT